jgi:hypothetical protein
MAWEEAGWEPRAKIAHVFGSGFPKSLDISKALDKMAGAEREDLGPNPNQIGRVQDMRGGNFVQPTEKTKREDFCRITAPATPAAKQWAGWGSAIKPSHEDWWLFRKPLAEKTIAENVLRWGTGALNIDGCRVEIHPNDKESYDFNNNGLSRMKRPEGDKLGQFDGGWKIDKPPRENNSGRFPANLIWSHSPNCKRIGTKKVKGSQGVRGRGSAIYANGKGYANTLSEVGQTVGYVDENGLEEVESWDCDPSCPSWQFAKAGERKTGICPRDAASIYQDPKIRRDESKASNGGDTGSAARFFQSCSFTEEDIPAFLYYAKASRSERERGLDGMQIAVSHSTYGEYKGTPEHGPNTNGHAKNFHPTVKPLSLMRYLCRLITPPDGVVLDPFAGSGTTCMAAKAEGFHYIGIEREAEYAEIARRRIAAIPTSLSRWVEDARQ